MRTIDSLVQVEVVDEEITAVTTRSVVEIVNDIDASRVLLMMSYVSGLLLQAAIHKVRSNMEPPPSGTQLLDDVIEPMTEQDIENSLTAEEKAVLYAAYLLS